MIVIPSVPVTWKLVVCGDIIDVRDGTHDTPAQVADGIPLVTSKNLKPEGINFEDVTFISEADHLEIEKRSSVEDGDVLFAMIGTIGNPVIVRKDRRFSIKNVALFKLRESPLLPAFFKELLSSQIVRTQLDNALRGGNQKFVPLTVLRNLLLPLPPIIEQRRIADVLGRADALRAKRRSTLAQVDFLTQSIFLDLFGDPVVNPNQWPRKLFSEIGTLERGVSKHRPRNAAELLGGPYPLIQTGEVAKCNGYIREYHSTYSEVGFKQSKIWPAGTLCITIAANIAKTGILTFDACFPDSIVGFRAENSATVEFVRGWLSFLQKSLEEAAPESAQKNINLAILRNLSVPLPPLALQCEFARRVQAVERVKAANRSSLAELHTLFASLQYRAFRGEL